MLYYLIIGLQLYCAYHIYKTQNPPYWYLIILLVPLLGSAIYLFTQISKPSSVTSLTKELQDNFQPSKKIEKLEKQLAFADTFQNRVLLAEGYLAVEAFAKAEQTYLQALEGSHSHDYDTQCQLLYCYYQQEKFEKVIEIARRLQQHSNFEKSQFHFLYGMSLAQLGKDQQALPILQKVDQRYSNYEERLQLSQYYIKLNRPEDARTLLTELLIESDNMTPVNQKRYKTTMTEVKEVLASVETAE